MPGTHVRFDWAMKRLLRNKANFEVLEGFLSELLKFDVKIIEILESESNKQDIEDKFNRVDILVKDENEKLILIEVQNDSEADYFHRMNYGQAKLLTEHLNEGQKYGEIKKIYSINIVYFDLGQGEDYVYVGKTQFKGMHKNDILQLSPHQKKTYNIEDVSDIYTTYYILKVNQFDDVARNTLDEWIYFLKNSEIKDNFKAKGLEKAKEVLDLGKLSREERKEFENYLKYWRVREAEIETARIEVQEKYEKQLAKERKEKEEAKRKAEQERKEKEEAKKRAEQERKEKEEAKKREEETKERLLNTARLLKEKGFDIDTIIENTGLSKEEIEKL